MVTCIMLVKKKLKVNLVQNLNFVNFLITTGLKIEVNVKPYSLFNQ